MSTSKSQANRAALMGAAEVAFEAAQLAPKLVPVGDAASKKALERLNAAIGELRQQEIPQLLRRAISAVNGGDYALGEKLALGALNLDEKQGIAWHILGIAREKIGDYGGSLRCYDAALKLLPDETAIALDLGRLASRLGMPDFAVKLYAIHLEKDPSSLEALNNLATSLRSLGRFDEAVSVIKPVLTENPQSAMLWNTLGTILCNQGDPETAIIFLDEALRLQPKFSLALYNRANARYDMHDPRALEDCERAIEIGAGSAELDSMKFSRSILILASGDLVQGWDAYEARFLPGQADAPRFIAETRRWEPEDDLEGKHIAVFTEQGVGDEILFSSLLPELIEALGPDGKLTLAVEKRLQPLFERSFPDATVVSHKTVRLEGRVTRGSLEIEDWSKIDLWTPGGSLLRRFRSSIDAFPASNVYLKADPERVAHWRAWLDTLPSGPKVGLLWKSQRMEGERARYYSPFETWRSVMNTPGATFINVQYGDCVDEIEYARSEIGIEVFQPPEIDLKQDLDDLAALVTALDVVMGMPNATTQIAGAVGTPLWMVSTANGWTQMNTDYYPWFPQARVFTTEKTSDWTPVMEKVAAELARAVAGEIPFSRQA